MNTTTAYKDGKSLSSMTYKHPAIFDGEDTNKFKDWLDNADTTLEMEDLEEYVGEDFDGIAMPSKDSCTPADLTNAVQVTAAHMNTLVRRKEMKKVKAHLVRRVTKGDGSHYSL